jgi:hypothetical protein
VSYISDIVSSLVHVLKHTRGLPRHQLAGHAANIEFWIGEACHALEVIDGYNHRFYRMRTAQIEHDREHGGHAVNNPAGWETSPTSEKPMRPSVTDAELKEMRSQVLSAANDLLDRLVNERVLSPEDRRALDSRVKG